MRKFQTLVAYLLVLPGQCGDGPNLNSEELEEQVFQAKVRIEGGRQEVTVLQQLCRNAYGTAGIFWFLIQVFEKALKAKDESHPPQEFLDKFKLAGSTHETHIGLAMRMFRENDLKAFMKTIQPEVLNFRM